MTKQIKMQNTNRAVKTAQADFAQTFEAFKAANDARLDSLEKKHSVDTLTLDKVERINAALDQQQKQLERLSVTLATPLAGGSEASEMKSAWSRYIRSGDTAGLDALEAKSLSSAVDGEGGYVAPAATESTIDSVLSASSPFRQFATVRQVSAGQFKKPVSLTNAVAGWAGETAARSETSAPSLDLLDFPVGELYAMPAATQTLLDDAVADVDAWLAEEVRDVFAAQETAAFVSGDGVNKPKGILSYTAQLEGNQSAKELGYVVTGQSGGFNGSAPVDALLDLIYAPDSRYRAQGRFLMNRRTVSAVRKLKDADGNYIWQPGLQAGQPSTLLGYAISEVEDMPDIGTDSFSICFGDMKRGYLVVDRQGVRVLRDPYSAKPYVLFYTTKRVGGGIQDFGAIKLLKFGTA